MEEGPRSRVTRREFVVAGGVAVSALGAASLGWPAGKLAAAPVSHDGLSPARAATYAALVEALALAPETGVVDASQSQEAMDRWYASAPATTRTYIDGVLDSVEDESSGSFKAKGAADRLKLLRGWVGGRRRGLGGAVVVLGAPVVGAGTDTPAPSVNYLRP
jgi:hypothetical protein